MTPSVKLMRLRFILAKFYYEVRERKEICNSHGCFMYRLDSDAHETVEINDNYPSFLMEQSDDETDED